MSHPGWSGLFVEPVPYLFERLRQNYGPESRFRFENVAITTECSAATFYCIAEEAKVHIPELPVWYDQLGSFDRSHITKHFHNSAIEPFIRELSINCISLPELLRRNCVQQVDILHIDTEGHDWAILKQLDLSQYLPSVILFEHSHLSMEEKLAAQGFLEAQYEITTLTFDYFCKRRGGG